MGIRKALKYGQDHFSLEETYRLGIYNFSMEHRESHVHYGLGEFDPTLENVAALISLPMFGESHAIGIVLVE